MKIVINTCYGGFGLSPKALNWLSEKGVNMDDGIERHNPLLVECVETLGSKDASGSYSSLSVVEIPDGVDYIVPEYDGYEHIAENHRTWHG